MKFFFFMLGKSYLSPSITGSGNRASPWTSSMEIIVIISCLTVPGKSSHVDAEVDNILLK